MKLKERYILYTSLSSVQNIILFIISLSENFNIYKMASHNNCSPIDCYTYPFNLKASFNLSFNVAYVYVT